MFVSRNSVNSCNSGAVETARGQTGEETQDGRKVLSDSQQNVRYDVTPAWRWTVPFGAWMFLAFQAPKSYS
jgi:hypothetical protein